MSGKFALPARSRWKVLGESADPAKLHCRCTCGTERDVNTKNMVRGLSLSCGCLTREITREMRTTHGKSNSSSAPHALYATWATMNQRCSNPNSASWPRYGGRGITVCDAWRTSFPQFLADVGERPSPAYSIDRIDNDGNYEPGNVRWATASEQGRNKSLKSHCTNGHEFTPENTGERSDGKGRECLTCKQAKSLIRSAKNRVPCTCGHISLSHRYLSSTSGNTGFCLAPNRWCEEFEEAPNGSA